MTKHRDVVARYDVFGSFLFHVQRCGGADIVRPLMMTSKEASDIVATDSLDLVFLDADHSYSATLTDIRLWRNKVRHGGILCGHDCEGRPEDYGRERLIQNRAVDAIAATRFPEIHPGCILAVDEAFEGRAQLFAETPFPLSDGRLACSTVWYIRCERAQLPRIFGISVLRSASVFTYSNLVTAVPRVSKLNL